MASRPKYPVYIVSKGRAYKPLTAKVFENAGIDYFIVVEPQEKAEYIEALSEKRVLVLPFSNLGLGSFPARNFCWEHSISQGHEKHWIFDDNIVGWRKWVNGKRVMFGKDSSLVEAFIYVEEFSDRKHIDICGFEEPNFVTNPPKKPFKINCHVYSAILINNRLKYRWRLKYNEDVDLCLQVLHGGGSTASCIYFMADKISTSVKMRGGNQDELYKSNDPSKKLLKATMLAKVWPQYAKVIWRFGRYHHFVNWNVFKKKVL